MLVTNRNNRVINICFVPSPVRNVMDSLPKEGGNISHNAVKKCALLVIVGEAFSEDDKKLILVEVTKGFSCWDSELIGFDINDELADIANRAALGDEGPNGERIIRYNSENLAVEILVDPLSSSLRNALKNFLSLHTQHKHLIYAKHAFQGTGAWMLQDDIFTFHDFAHIFKDTVIDNAVRQQHGTSLCIYTGAEGDWTDSNIAKSDFSKLLDAKLNPPAKLETLHGVLQFTAYVSNFVRVRQLNELLQSSGVVGNIRFTNPTMYIFPAGQGDSALLGVNGFNLLINGGYSRKACFWDFTRHLDRIDAALITHLGADNLFGIQSVFQRKGVENLHPDIGYLYFNAPDKMKTVTEINKKESGNKENLLVNVAEESDKLLHYAKQIGLTPHPCLRMPHGNIEPFNLYQKIGIGSLDIYILNPVTDSKDLKDFFHQWNQNVTHFGTSQHLSLPNTLSVCALLVWHPADPNGNISRILFPGNAPQHKILEGLEKLKTLDILKHPSCTKMSLNTKHATKKPAVGLFSKPPKSKVLPVIAPKTEMPKNEVTKKEVKEPVPPKTVSHAKEKPLQKAKKEDVNKKVIKAPEKQKSERLDKGKQTKPMPSSGLTKCSAKSSAASTLKEKSAQVKTPEPVQVQEVLEGKHEVPESEHEVLDSRHEVHESEQEVFEDHTPSTAESGDHTCDTETDDINQEPESVVEVIALEEPESVAKVIELEDEIASEVPDTNQFAPESEQIQETEHLDKAKMSELGIYDNDDEQYIENEYDDKPESEENSQQSYGGMADSMHQDVYQQDAVQGSFHGDLMTESMHESIFDSEQPFGDQNGGNILTQEDEIPEEIQPQALPEPIAYAPDSYIQEPHVIPTFSYKEESQIVLCEDSTAKIQEPDILPIKRDFCNLAVSDNKVDDQADISGHKNTAADYEHPLIEMSEKIANVITQECVEDNEYIEENIVKENEQVNSAAAMLNNAAEDVKRGYIDMDVPSFITGDLSLPSPNDKEDPVEGEEAESHIYEHDMLRQSQGEGKTIEELHDVDNTSPHCDSNQHESGDQPYENESDKSEQEDGDDNESSSYEQEQATDEKCLIQDSTSEDYQVLDGRTFEAAQGDSFTELTSDNLLTPESELTDPSTGGQMGYHQIDDQGDSVDGFEDQDCYAVLQTGQTHQTSSEQDYSYHGGPAVFNPSTVWGQPMGLPLPAPPGDKTEGTSMSVKNSPKPKLLSKANDTKKTDEKKLNVKVHTVSTTAKESVPTPKSAASNGVTEKTKAPSTGGAGANTGPSKSSAELIASKPSTVDKVAITKAGTNPRSANASSKDKELTDSKPKQNGAKRPATANASVSSPASVKMPSLPSFSSYHFDLTYIPNHGNSNYVDVEFFKRVRARYYVLSALSPSTQVLDALLEGKITWENKTLPVTVIPTYDNETMRLWMTQHKDKLAEENVEIAPSASRCTIQLQDHETSSSAYRLEF